jgi:hypothetical protein
MLMKKMHFLDIPEALCLGKEVNSRKSRECITKRNAEKEKGKKMKYRVFLILAVVLLLMSPFQSNATEPNATHAQIQAEIDLVDPGHLATWYFTMPDDYSGGDTYGVALPWNNSVYLQGNQMPASLVDSIVIHEYAHMLQYVYIGYSPHDFLTLESVLTSWVQTTPGLDPPHQHVPGIEYLADCMAQLQDKNAGNYFYGCPSQLNQLKTPVPDMLSANPKPTSFMLLAQAIYKETKGVFVPQ